MAVVKKPDSMSLVSLAPGQRARVEAICCGHGFRMRLAALGIIPGTLITVLRNAGAGPVIVEARGGRLALGRGQAARIEVQPISSEGEGG